MPIDGSAKNRSDYTYSSGPFRTREEMNCLAYEFSFIE